MTTTMTHRAAPRAERSAATAHFTEHQALYGILGTGLALSFFGHAMWAVQGSEKFVALVTDTYHNVLGGTMSTATATDIVKTIGWIDTTISIVVVALVVAALTGRRIAANPFALGLYTYAATWGFLTAASRVTAGGWADVWDLVERGPNFLLPLALLYLAMRMRRAGELVR